jgi:hypothetical protein
LGFTLIESAIATVIVGTGILSMVAAQQAWHRQNDWAERAAIGTRLGNEIREMTFNLARHDPVTGAALWGPELNEVDILDFDDLDDFDGEDGEGLILSDDQGNGPVNALRDVIPGMQGWSQEVRVFNIDPSDVNLDVADGTSDLMRVEVQVFWQGPFDPSPVKITRVDWIAPN